MERISVLMCRLFWYWLEHGMDAAGKECALEASRQDEMHTVNEAPSVELTAVWLQ